MGSLDKGGLTVESVGNHGAFNPMQVYCLHEKQ